MPARSLRIIFSAVSAICGAAVTSNACRLRFPVSATSLWQTTQYRSTPMVSESRGTPGAGPASTVGLPAVTCAVPRAASCRAELVAAVRPTSTSGTPSTAAVSDFILGFPAMGDVLLLPGGS